MNRPASTLEAAGFMARSVITTFRRGQHDRVTKAVVDEYSIGWARHKPWLDRASSIESWLTVPGIEDAKGVFNVDGRLVVGEFRSADFYRDSLIKALQTHFPTATSFCEYGCGVGRNLLVLKRQFPDADCYGYELCQSGVDVARTAATKFGIDVKYSQLDYVNDPPEKYIFPDVDVAFTLFSLEQLPRHSDIALRNILARTRMGSVHMEPVRERYPNTARGYLGRIEHRKVDYLGDFDRTAHAVPDIDVTVEPLNSSHNPLMFPSVYILKKSGAR
jgi:hypothetical protein